MNPLVYKRTTDGLGRHVIFRSDSGIRVPLKFSGIQNATYPVGYGVLSTEKLPPSMSAHDRSHDLSGSCSMWRNLHTGVGQFDATSVSRMDRWIEQCYADDTEVTFAIYGTPAWIADTSIDWTDQYGQRYNANAPSDLNSNGSPSLAAYVTWFMTRYYKKIKYVEAWNEPLFASTSSTYFTGTPVQMARMMKAVYQAVKAVDPSVLVLSPGFAGMSSGLNPMVQSLMTAAVGDGTTGKDWCDAVAFHPYDLGIHAFHSIYPVASALQTFIADAAAYAPGKPLFNTEQGFLHGWNGITQNERAEIIKKSALLQAALGVQKITWYGAANSYASGQTVSPTYVANNILGGPLVDKTIRAAFEWVQNLSGITIYEVGMSSGGVMYGITDKGVLSTR